MTGYATIKIGGGGFVTGVDFSSDGLTNLCRTDTAGAYILISNTWQQLCTSTIFGTNTQSVDSGVVEICSAPSNSAVIYMYYGNMVYKSTNRGITFTACAGWSTAWTASANDQSQRLSGRKMAVDPIDPNTLIVCPQDSSAPPKISTNGGTTFASVPTIAAGSGFCVVFDTSGGSTGGKTNNIIIWPRGLQAYFSLNGGGSFTITSGGPTNATHLVTGAGTGICWATDGGTNSLWKYVVSTNTWSSITGSPAIGMGGNAVHSVAVDPTNSAHIVLVNDAGDVQSSTNSGGAWGSLFIGSAQTIPAGQPGWLGYTSNYGMSAGDAVFESTGTTLYFGAGIGVWTLPPASPVNWSCLTANIENLTSVCIVSPPSASRNPVLVSWDRQVQYITDPTVFPSQNGVNTAFNFGWHADYSQVSGNTKMIALINFIGASDFDYSSSSSDNGQNWTQWATLPHVYTATLTANASSGTTLTFGGGVPANVYVGMLVKNVTTGTGFPTDSQIIKTTATTVDINNTITGVSSGNVIEFRGGTGGSVAVSTNTNWMMVPSNNSPFPFYTTDGGSTWLISAMPSTAAAGNPPTPFTGTINTGNGIVTGININTNKLRAGDNYQNLNSFLQGTISTVDSSSQVTMSFNGAINGTSGFTPIPSGFSNAYYDNTVFVCADSVTANKFYLYNTVTHLCYVSTDSGATFTVASSSLSGTLADQEVLLKNVPGKAGHLFLCAGNGAFMRSSNSGVTWTSVPNMAAVGTFGFGKPKTGGGGYPIILATGQYLGVGGGNRIWRSDDGDQATPTWAEPATGAVNGLLDSITRIDGDKNVENQFYFSWHGSSAGFFDAGSSGPVTPAFGFSVITDSGQRRTRMIGY